MNAIFAHALRDHTQLMSHIDTQNKYLRPYNNIILGGITESPYYVL